jgi:hypothetical protein
MSSSDITTKNYTIGENNNKTILLSDIKNSSTDIIVPIINENVEIIKTSAITDPNKITIVESNEKIVLELADGKTDFIKKIYLPQNTLLYLKCKDRIYAFIGLEDYIHLIFMGEYWKIVDNSIYFNVQYYNTELENIKQMFTCYDHHLAIISNENSIASTQSRDKLNLYNEEFKLEETLDITFDQIYCFEDVLYYLKEKSLFKLQLNEGKLGSILIHTFNLIDKIINIKDEEIYYNIQENIYCYNQGLSEYEYTSPTEINYSAYKSKCDFLELMKMYDDTTIISVYRDHNLILSGTDLYYNGVNNEDEDEPIEKNVKYAKLIALDVAVIDDKLCFIHERKVIVLDKLTNVDNICISKNKLYFTINGKCYFYVK